MISDLLKVPSLPTTWFSIKSILDQLEVVEKKILSVLFFKRKLLKSLRNNFEGENIDMNRFEQELFYYIERLDITEEKVRLRQHLIISLEEINKEKYAKSRKLNFITQK